MRLRIAALVLAAQVMAAPDAVLATSPAEAEAEALAQRAQSILDGSDRTDAALREVDAAIAESMRKRPNAHALVERARLTMIVERESKSSFVLARESLRRAEVIDPAYDRTYVLEAYVAMWLGDHRAALAALQKAEQLHSDDPWFKLNYAMFHQSEGRNAEANRLREEVLRSDTTNAGALSAARQQLQDYYLLMQDRPNFYRVYRLAAEKSPRNAYLHGDHAREAITAFADFDEGEAAARRALAIMDYPHARQTVSLALYGRWAAARRDHKDFTLVQHLLAVARAYDPDASMVPTCALKSPKLFFLRDALIALEARRDPSLHNC
jgi:hypothetical protein